MIHNVCVVAERGLLAGIFRLRTAHISLGILVHRCQPISEAEWNILNIMTRFETLRLFALSLRTEALSWAARRSPLPAMRTLFVCYPEI